MKKIWWYIVLIGTIGFAFLLVLNLGNIANINFSESIIGTKQINMTDANGNVWYTTTVYTLNIRQYLQNLEQTLTQPIDMFNIPEIPDIKTAALSAKPKGSDILDYLTWIPKLIVNTGLYMINLFFWAINFSMNFVRFGLTAIRLIMTILGLNTNNPFYNFINSIYNFKLAYTGYL